MAATPLPAGTNISETIGGKEYNRAIIYDVTGVAVKFYLDTQPISATSLPLPNGAATDAKVEAVRALLAGTLTVGLPAGAATATNQVNVKNSIDGQGPADDIFAITPSDTVALATVPKALLALTAGNVAVRGTGANPVTIPVVAGQVLPIRARYVYATNTNATVVGLA